MKINIKRSVILAGWVVLMPYACNRDKSSSVNPAEAVVSVTQAHLYHYVIFREAEYAWGAAHRNGYTELPMSDTDGHGQRTITYRTTESGKSEVEAAYTAWQWGNMSISGILTVDLPDKNLYRQKDKQASIRLTGFSINGQTVTGYATFRYAGNDSDDHYSYSFSNAAIYGADEQQILILSSISAGNFVRKAGSDTADQDDDRWTFTGTMSGNLNNNTSLTYSNSVTEEMTFDWDCSNKAVQGKCSLAVTGQAIEYDCGASCNDAIRINSTTHKK
ncbi:MAG: hypothetical protein LBS09_01820 [Bacteroidales bacterium]|jgi:hypothetical protein|nr:hypothetical protein [Bacteroidales bacterium]